MTSAQLLLFLAVVAQVLLTLAVYLLLLRARTAAVKSGVIDWDRAALDSSAWPNRARVISNALTSQFELPVLFYVAVLFIFALGAASWMTAALAWGFVAARVAHMLIHTGANRIRPRLGAFLVSVALVVALWAALTAHAVKGWMIHA